MSSLAQVLYQDNLHGIVCVFTHIFIYPERINQNKASLDLTTQEYLVLPLRMQQGRISIIADFLHFAIYHTSMNTE